MEWPVETAWGDISRLLQGGVNTAVILEKYDGSTVRYELAEHEHHWTQWVAPDDKQGWAVWWRNCPACDEDETSIEDPR